MRVRYLPTPMVNKVARRADRHLSPGSIRLEPGCSKSGDLAHPLACPPKILPLLLFSGIKAMSRPILEKTISAIVTTFYPRHMGLTNFLAISIT